MFRRTLAAGCILLLIGGMAHAQLRVLETKDLRLVYYGEAIAYLVPHVARTFAGALHFEQGLFGYRPDDKNTIVLLDLKDLGNASAGPSPRNHILFYIAPSSYTFETILGNERIQSTLNHELVHIMTSDQPAPRDRLFRKWLGGKGGLNAENPLTIPFGFLTTPRLWSPRWYMEGIAVFLETWMAGGMGRALGAYDEMVFRTLVRDGGPLYDMVSLDSAAPHRDFQGGSIHYLYGCRFFSWLALTHGPEKLIEWVARKEGTRTYFSAQFARVYGQPIERAWSEWLAWEREFQHRNLARLAENPLTPWRPVGPRALGSVSRPCLDPATHKVYLGVNYPGQAPHLAALDLTTGKMEKLCDVRGGAKYMVTSPALDRQRGRLYYTTDNNDWRDLYVYDLKQKRSRRLMNNERVGDLAFDAATDSLWGVRHDNGISTLVRIPPPYDRWQQVHSWPFGTDFYDLDIAPGGDRLTGALTHIDGSQELVCYETARLLAGEAMPEVLGDFANNSPASFVFSADGRTLYGSSYYSGVANIYRYDFQSKEIEPLTNADTGFFRPLPLGDGNLLAFRYTATGFVPVLLREAPVTKVNAITFLGQRVVEERPLVKGWVPHPPSQVDLDREILYHGPYRPLKHLQLWSLVPAIEGYKDSLAFGLQVQLADAAIQHRVSATLGWSPDGGLAADERLHLRLDYDYRDWRVSARWNPSDFYDLFGPTKTSRKGYSLGLQHRRHLLFDEPNRAIELLTRLSFYGGMENLPDFQNVATPVTSFATASVGLKGHNQYQSLGAIEDEKGANWDLEAATYLADGEFFPRVSGAGARGLSLPQSHSSLWLRGAVGSAWGDRNQPFSRFYFGGFGNNWVDHRESKRFREPESFPGLGINEVPARTFARAQVEWTLPPVFFQRLGSPAFFASWTGFSLFSTVLATDLDRRGERRLLGNLGAQVDLRLTLLSYNPITLSLGGALAVERHRQVQWQWLASLKVM